MKKTHTTKRPAALRAGSNQPVTYATSGLPEIKVVTLRECLVVAPKASSPKGIARLWRKFVESAYWFSPDKESFVVFLLDVNCRCIGFNMVSTGSLKECSAPPNEVFRAPILCAAAGVVFVHNHPSGDPKPSEADIKATRRLVRVGVDMGIDVADHVIMGSKAQGYTSLKQLGYLY